MQTFLGLRNFSGNQASASWLLDTVQTGNVALYNMSDIPGEHQDTLQPFSAYKYVIDITSIQRQFVFGMVSSLQLKIKRIAPNQTDATHYQYPGRFSVWCPTTNYVYTLYARNIANNNPTMLLGYGWEYTNVIVPFFVPPNGQFVAYVELDSYNSGGGASGVGNTTAVVTAFNYNASDGGLFF